MKKITSLRRLAVALLVSGVSLHAAAQAYADRTIRVGHQAQPDAPISQAARKFAELVAEKSGGRLKVKEFPASQLGNEAQQLGALRGGTQELFIPTTTSLASVIKEFGLLDFPFLVSTTAQAEALLDGPAGAALLERLPAKGLIGLGYWENGFRNVTNSARPIQKPEDFAGLKLRVIPNPVFIEAFKALGANPTPLAFGELYGALESRAVDGQENPYVLIDTSKFYEVQKFASNTNHVYSPLIVLAGKPFWDKLSDSERQILQAAFKEAQAYQRALSRQATTSAMAEVKAKGMKINDVSPAELQRMEAVVRPVTDKFAATYDPAITRGFFAELQKIKQK
ncbi:MULTISPECIES: TRAP transporter substrate-binding protein [Acidovorax]|uniref:TRAP transporter substrate-binding protein n=1 Tax=Acidovorax TaxID=12916 RepID=UPI00083E7DB8|nr:TRAP transporter substrate-binding protein [Acidovorax sp. RAC01]AOG22720.1 TRAP transporter solute receptor, DctP family protein [Acidovorax sp. RAC01]